MRITFVLPSAVRIPMGGATVVFRHAEGLAKRGHMVTVLCQSQLTDGIRGRAMALAARVRDRLHGLTGEPYYSPPGVATVQVGRLVPEVVPNGDVLIATGWQTAEAVAHLPAAKGRKFYFVQGLESYQSPRALDTWHLPMSRFTCAHWLAERIRAAGEEVIGVVPNAVSPEHFYPERPIAGRRPSVVALYHRAEIKGPTELIATLVNLRTRIPELEATVFSARPPSHKLLGWVRIEVRPAVERLRQMYNDAAVLLHTSTLEGWPLVPMEAAACGCAVAGFANEGVREYLADGDTASLVEMGDVDALTEASANLLTNETLRIERATAARAAVAQFSWEASTDILEGFLQ
ncbi:glycosyltransferase family 4 protein [soil metagenome]